MSYNDNTSLGIAINLDRTSTGKLLCRLCLWLVLSKSILRRNGSDLLSHPCKSCVRWQSSCNWVASRTAGELHANPTKCSANQMCVYDRHFFLLEHPHQTLLKKHNASSVWPMQNAIFSMLRKGWQMSASSNASFAFNCTACRQRKQPNNWEKLSWRLVEWAWMSDTATLWLIQLPERHSGGMVVTLVGAGFSN